MAELTVYASTNDGQIMRFATSYSSARGNDYDGTNLASSTGDITVGQSEVGVYRCYQAYIQYDTSMVQGDVTNVKEYLYLGVDETDTDYTEEVRAYDWGSSVTGVDWVPGDSLNSHSLLSSKTTPMSAGYNEFDSSSAFAAAVNAGGITKLMHNSSRQRIGNAPSTGTDEYTTWKSADASGTTQDPKLVITYTPPPAIITFDGEGGISVTGDMYIPLLWLQEPSVTTRSPIATHITVKSPTHSYSAHITPEPAESTRVERMVTIEAGDATVCQAVAEKLIDRWGRVQLSISGVISLETRLDFDTKVRVIIPRAGINGRYPVQRREHDVFARTTTLSMGDIMLGDNELIARLLQDLINK